MKAAQAARQNAQKFHESFIFTRTGFQHDSLECAAGLFWLILGLSGSDRAETEQVQRTTPELRFA